MGMGFLIGCVMGVALGMGVWSIVEEDWMGTMLYGGILGLIIMFHQLVRT